MGTVTYAIAVESFRGNSPLFTVQFRFISATACGAARYESSLITSGTLKRINRERKMFQVGGHSMSERKRSIATKMQSKDKAVTFNKILFTSEELETHV